MATLKDLESLRGAFTWTMLLIFLIMNITVFSFGFDNSVYSSIQAMTPYEKMFGKYNKKTKTWGFSAQHLSFLNSLGDPAKGLGTIISYLVGENFGRKPCFIAMQFVAIAGIAVTYTATTFAQALAGRMIVQCFVGWEDWLIPMFLAKLAPASVRGATVVVYVFAHFFFGSLICSFVTLGSSKLDGNRSWQIPVAVMFIFPCTALLLSYFVPESPRYLIRNNKYEADLTNLKYLYRGDEAFSAENEAALLHSSIEADIATKGKWSDLWKGTNLVFHPSTEQFVKSLDTFDPFVFTVLNRVSSLIGPIISFTFIDSVGRRPIYIVGGLCTGIAMMSIGGLGIGNVTVSHKKGIIASVILFGPFYSGTFGSLGAVTGAEAPHLRLRDKTSVVAYVTHIVFAFIAVVWAYFCLPEMRRRSLEELEDMWRAKVPARKFRSWKAPDGSVGAMITMNENNKTRHDGTFDPNNQDIEHLKDV